MKTLYLRCDNFLFVEIMSFCSDFYLPIVWEPIFWILYQSCHLCQNDLRRRPFVVLSDSRSQMRISKKYRRNKYNMLCRQSMTSINPSSRPVNHNSSITVPQGRTFFESSIDAGVSIHHLTCEPREAVSQYLRGGHFLNQVSTQGHWSIF